MRPKSDNKKQFGEKSNDSMSLKRVIDLQSDIRSESSSTKSAENYLVLFPLNHVIQRVNGEFLLYSLFTFVSEDSTH